jgi:quercetin dioxygenase-like cupin family protein
MNFAAFKADMLARGFDTVVEREWPPDMVVDVHSHPFEAQAIVVRGEMWLTVDGVTRHLQPGGTFSLAAGIRHSERYGAVGATYWVGRRGP